MSDSRDLFWAGIKTRLVFDNDGIPIVYASTTPGTGVNYTSQKPRLATHYKKGEVVEINIGKYDHAYAILHGELQLEGLNLPPHLLVTFLHWDDEEPIYQSDYRMEEDEVIPSDEIEIIPSTMLSGKHCLLGALPDGTGDESDCEEMGGIHWKRSHVYISGTATVMTITEAARLPILLREPTTEAIEAARARHSEQTRAQQPSLRTPSPRRHRAGDSHSWRTTQSTRFSPYKPAPIYILTTRSST